MCETVDYPLQVTETIAVSVAERSWVNLINRGSTPPRVVMCSHPHRASFEGTERCPATGPVELRTTSCVATCVDSG